MKLPAKIKMTKCHYKAYKISHTETELTQKQGLNNLRKTPKDKYQNEEDGDFI